MTIIIDDQNTLDQFTKALTNADYCSIKCIAENDFSHPLNASLSLVLFRVKDNFYVFGINHPEVLPFYTKSQLEVLIDSFPLKKYVFDKKEFQQRISIRKNVIDIQILSHLTQGTKIEVENPVCTNLVKSRCFHSKNVNTIIPVFKHKDKFQRELINAEKFYTQEIPKSFDFFNSKVTNVLSLIERNGLYVNKKLFDSSFEFQQLTADNLIYSQYNMFTSTGRPSNRFGHINFSALNKESKERECFISRFGKAGKLIQLDYQAFHPRLISEMIGMPFKMDENPYKILAEKYFNKTDITVDDINKSKQITFKLLYGGITEEYQKIDFFGKTFNLISGLWEQFTDRGYIETLHSQKLIYKHQIDNAFPNKVFNYFLQNFEMEVGTEMLYDILLFLKGKTSKLILYTYDSILIDFCKDDGPETLRQIKILMEDGKFPVSSWAGDNYHSLKRINF